MNFPEIAIVFSGSLLFICLDISFKALSQVSTDNLFSFLIKTLSNLCFERPSIANLVLSLIHSSFISSFDLGKTLKTLLPIVSTLILEPIASKTSCVSVLVNSQGLDLKA